MADYWWSIEVLDGEFPAGRWKDAHSAALIEAALSHGAQDWNWSEHRWGVVFEMAWKDPIDWATFRALPAVTAALDAIPNPAYGLLVYQGRGGSSGSVQPRHPRPRLGAGAGDIPREPVAILVAKLDEMI
jgi:hypothetical protein